MWEWAFWKQTIERVVFTVVETFLGAMGVDQLGIVDLPYAHGLNIALAAGLLTLLKSLLAGLAPTDPTANPSFVSVTGT